MAPSRPKRIGLISDTHGLLRDEAVQALKGSSLIIHAGDIGKPEILESLRALAPVVAIRGNIDTANWALALPEATTVQSGPLPIHVIHDVHQLAIDPVAAGYRIIVSGHSHRPSSEERAGVLYVNPGSAGPRRFCLPVTVAHLDLAGESCRVEFINLLTS